LSESDSRIHVTDRRTTMMTHKRGVTSLVAMMCLAAPSTLSAHGLHATGVADVWHGALHLLEVVAVVVVCFGVGRALVRRVKEEA